MAMTLDTALRFTAKLEGQGLDQLKRALQGLGQQSSRSSRDLDQLYNASRKLSAAAGTSINALQRQITVMSNLRNEAQIGSRQFRFYSAELEKLQRQQARLDSAGGQGGLLGALSGVRGGFAGVAAVAGTLGVSRIVGGIANASMEAEVAQVRLKALADTYGEYNQAQEIAARLADTLRITNTEATDSFAKLYAGLRPTGVSLKELEQIFTGFNVAARTSGATAEETSAAMIQLKQALVSGRAQGDELRSILEQAPALGQAVAEQMTKLGTFGKVTRSQLKELGAEGKITTDVLIEALRELGEKELPKLEKSFGTGQQAVKDLSNATNKLQVAIGDAFGPIAVGLVQLFTKAVSGAADALQRYNKSRLEGGNEAVLKERAFRGAAKQTYGSETMGGLISFLNPDFRKAYDEQLKQLQGQAAIQAAKSDRLDTSQLDAQKAADKEREASRAATRKKALEDETKIRLDAEEKLADAAQRNAEQLADFREQTIKRAADLERDLGDQRLQIERSIAEARRRIAEQEQDQALEVERQRLAAAGLSTEGIDAARELGEISRRYSEQRIQNEQTATDRQVQLQRQLEDFKTSVADGIGKIQEGYARSVSNILQDAGDKLAAKMVGGAQAAAGALSGAGGGVTGGMVGPSNLRSGSVQGGRLSVGTLVGLAKAAGFNDRDARIMAAIAMAESGGRSSAFNGNAATGDKSYGLWQVNMLGAMGPERRRQFGIGNNAQLFDPATNAMAARRVFQSQGFGAWSVFRSGAYRQFLPNAMQAQPMGPAAGGFNSSGLMGGIQRAGQQLGGTIGTEQAVKNQQAFNDLFNGYLGKFGEYKQDLDGATRSAAQQLQDQQRLYELMRGGLSPEMAQQRVEAESIANREIERLEALQNQLDLELQRSDLNPQQRAQLEGLKQEVQQRLLAEQGIVDEIGRQQQALENLNRQQQLLSDLTQSIGNTLSQGIIGGIDAAIEAAMTGAEGLEDKLKAIASGVLKDIGSALIRFGLNSLAGGLGLGGFLKFADGGVMTNAGPLPLRRYAGGGIANSPQMAVYGERGPEAYVPLPDGRNIPVKVQQRNDVLDRYRPMGATGTVTNDGDMAAAAGGAVAAGGAIDVRYTVERINNVEYVTAEQFQQGLQRAAREGAARGEQQTLRRLQTSASTRRKVGV
jgi:tape measure domain-containing protein